MTANFFQGGANYDAGYQKKFFFLFASFVDKLFGISYNCH